MYSNEKCWNYKVLNPVKLCEYRMCLHLRSFEKIKNLNLKICKFKILKTSNKNLMNNKYIDQVGHYNFNINFSRLAYATWTLGVP